LPQPIGENVPVVPRRSRLLLLLAVLAAAVVALAAPGPAAARVTPIGARWHVVVLEKISDKTLAVLAHRGAVGLMRPGYGPTTSRDRAIAELVRGAETNARLGGFPPGKALIGFNTETGPTVPHCNMCIVLQLPPRGKSMANNRLYRVAVIGQDFHGLLTSPTTRIPGLVSIVDIAPTALGRQLGVMYSVPASNGAAAVERLGAQIHGEDRLKYAGLFIVVAVLILLALLGWPAARTVIPAALLANLVLGVLHVTNEVGIVALFTVATVLGALLLARICREDLALLGWIVVVLVAYVVVFARRPEWAAVTPLGPDQNLRFWGIGDQIATLLFAPLLTGAVIARQRLGWLGFAAFSVLGLFVMTDNRLGANGGGAIGLGLALAVLSARLSRRGLLALAATLTAAGAIVLEIVKHGLASPGPNHLRSAFGSGIHGFLDVAVNRVPLVYKPALHDWPLTLPLAVLLIVSGVLAFRVTHARAARDILLALAAGMIASLLVNDATGFMLAGGIGCASAVARFVPTGAPLRLPVLSAVSRFRAALGMAPTATESPPS
jgi:hypothetical protein